VCCDLFYRNHLIYTTAKDVLFGNTEYIPFIRTRDRSNMNGLIDDIFRDELNSMEMLRPDGELTSLYFVADKDAVEPRIRIALGICGTSINI